MLPIWLWIYIRRNYFDNDFEIHKNMQTCDSFFFKYSKHLLYYSPSHAQKGTFKLQCVHFKITWKQAKEVESKLFVRRLCIITAHILYVI